MLRWRKVNRGRERKGNKKKRRKEGRERHFVSRLRKVKKGKERE